MQGSTWSLRHACFVLKFSSTFLICCTKVKNACCSLKSSSVALNSTEWDNLLHAQIHTKQNNFIWKLHYACFNSLTRPSPLVLQVTKSVLYKYGVWEYSTLQLHVAHFVCSVRSSFEAYFDEGFQRLGISFIEFLLDLYHVHFTAWHHHSNESVVIRANTLYVYVCVCVCVCGVCV